MHSIIVGGGLLGLSTGYELAKAGHRVTVLEAGPQLGGLASDATVDGIRVDRFYHCILNADDHLINLIAELGLTEHLRMRAVRAGFYTDGKIYPISTPLDLLRFPPLGMTDRLRLVKSLLACRRVKDWKELETIDVQSWLRKQSGDRVFERVWKPLLSAKFDRNFENTPATYIWSRTVRMSDTRSAGGQRELAGHLVGGYQTLCERLEERIVELGGTVRVGTPVQQVHTRDGRFLAVTAGDSIIRGESLVLTSPLPITARLLRDRAMGGVESDEQRQRISQYAGQVTDVQGYLGVVCVLLMLRRPLTENYTLYLADDELPFTAIIESTNIIDPELVGGRHLVYLPKYMDAGNPLFQMPDDELRSWFVGALQQMFPDLTDRDILAAPVFRAPHVEPLHPIGSLDAIPSIKTPIEGVWIGSTKHFYPRLNNGDSVTRLATEIATDVQGWASARSQLGRELNSSIAAD